MTGLRRAAAAIFAVALLYPLAGLFVPVGSWRWGDGSSTFDAIRTSIVFTAIAMIVVVAFGTPVALHIARSSARERLWWQALLLISVLLPPLALGILISLAFGPHALGAFLDRFGLKMTNTPLAFVVTQVYVSIGYYILGSVAALDAVPATLAIQGGLLGHDPWNVFWRITFPIARLGFAVALSLAWVRALTEFGAVAITAYYPAGMPVALWTGLENYGLPAVMPLLVVFLITALPFPWLAHLLAQRRFTIRA
ncbi:MAG: ABC transporter permease subunit [Candidatus Eremiobacteraeota bacterium]|nr:ABC transporter permease subunit [Candidatus Eremiobacteraeota bacterium]